MKKYLFLNLLLQSIALAQPPPPYQVYTQPQYAVPQKFSGVGLPGVVPGNLPGDIYVNTLTGYAYVCSAPQGSSSPACSSVTSGQWSTVGGGTVGPPGPAGALASNVEYTTSQVMTSADCPSAIKTFTGSSALTYTLISPISGCTVIIQNNTTQSLTINATTNSITLNGQTSNGSIPSCTTPANGCFAMRISSNGTSSWDASITQSGPQGPIGPTGPVSSVFTLTGAVPNLSGAVTTSGSSVTTLASKYSTSLCEPGLGDGLNAIPAGTYLQSSCINEFGSTYTITGVWCYTDNAGSSTLNITNGSSTGLLTGPITCSNTLPGVAGTQSGTTTIVNGDGIKFTFVGDGSSKQTTWVIATTR